MPAANIQRLPSDLATIRQAAGLDFQFTRIHVQLKLLFAISALAATIWAWFAQDLTVPIRVIGFAAILFSPGMIYSKVKQQDIPKMGLRRIFRALGLSVPWLAANAAAILLTVWLVRGQGLSPKAGLVVFCAVAGTSIFASAWKDRHEHAGAWVVGPLLILMALMWLWTSFQLDVLIGGFLFIGSLLQAAIWRDHLRQLGQWE